MDRGRPQPASRGGDAGRGRGGRAAGPGRSVCTAAGAGPQGPGRGGQAAGGRAAGSGPRGPGCGGHEGGGSAEESAYYAVMMKFVCYEEQKPETKTMTEIFVFVWQYAIT